MRKIILLAGLAVLSSAANAVLLYDQAAHTPGASGGNGLSAWDDGVTFDRTVADDFIVGAGGWRVDMVDTKGVWNAAPFARDPASGFKVQFWQDAANTPGALFNAQTSTSITRSATIGTWFGREGFRWDINIAAVNLTAGKWWVSITAVDPLNFFQLTSTPTTAVQNTQAHVREFRTGAGYPIGSWGTTASVFGTAHDAAFSIHGQAVPEPATMAALGLGVAALLRRRRK